MSSHLVDPTEEASIGVCRLDLHSFALTDEAGSYVADSPGSGWAPTARLAACYTPGDDLHRLFYVATTGSIVAWYRSGANDTWKPSSDPKWAKADGDLAAVAWGKQVRLLYMSGGKLAMSAYNKAEWADVEYL